MDRRHAIEARNMSIGTTEERRQENMAGTIMLWQGKREGARHRQQNRQACRTTRRPENRIENEG